MDHPYLAKKTRPCAGGCFRSWSSYGTKALEDMGLAHTKKPGRGFRVILRRAR